MSRPCHRLAPMRRLAVLFGTGLTLMILVAAPAQAELIPFLILIENGANFPLQATDALGLSVFARTGTPFYLVQNGTKGPQLGTAAVLVWARSVSDPFFAPFGPIAGLALLDFGGGLVGRLSLIQTPTEFRTTIGAIRNGGVQIVFAGSWVFGNGTSVVGGKANDLVIGGVLVTGHPTHLSSLALDVDRYFLTDSDPNPTGVPHCSSGCSIRTGSFYGQTVVSGQARPIRAYNTLLPGLSAHLGVIQSGDNSYIVVTCTSPLSSSDKGGCSVSVPGSAVAGGGSYDVQDITTDLTVDFWAIMP